MTLLEWKQRKLSDLCTLRAGSVFKLEHQGQVEGDYPFIKVSDMNLAGNELYIQNANHWVSDDTMARIKAKPLARETSVFAKIGEALKKNRVRFLTRDTIIDNNMMGAVPKRDAVDPKFLFYLLSGFDLASKATGAALPFLSTGILYESTFLIPPLPTQRNISLYLSAYDDLIENNRRRIALLEEAARLLYREWFVRFRFPGHEHAKVTDGVPSGWEKSPIGTAIPFSYGKSLTSEVRDDKGEYAVYGSSGVVGKHVEKLVDGPVILVGRKGNVGSVFFSVAGCWPIDTTYFVHPPHHPLYFYHALQNTQFLNTDVAVPGLNRDYAHSRPVLLPPADLLDTFEDQVAVFRAQAEVLGRQIRRLSEARDLLLPRLMDGRIAV